MAGKNSDVSDVMDDKKIDFNDDDNPSTISVKLERRRRIEELQEEKRLKEELEDLVF